MIDQAQIREDLAGVVRGELLFDDIARRLYSTDASIFQVQPLGVIVPADEEDVQAVVRYAAEHKLPITARGAGSGLAGESLGAGLIVDFTRNFRRILHIGADSVQVQPGVVYRDLQDELAKTGRRVAPDPASGTQFTVGGMLANNASGSRALKHGYIRDHVLSVRCVLDSSAAADCGNEPRRPAAAASDRKQQIVAAVAGLLERHADLIVGCQPRTRFNRCGYLLHDVVAPDALALARLLIGSEGTLALFTAATLRTIPLPDDRAVTLLGFASLEAAARAAQDCLPAGPSACELVDRRLLALACQAYPEYEKLITAAVQAVLLVEFEADATGAAATAARTLLRQFQDRGGLVVGVVADTPTEIDWLWRLRDLALPMLYKLRGHEQPIPFIEDVAVPVEHLAGYLHRVQEILQKHQTTASFLVHAGAGQVHTRPFLDLRQPENVKKLREMAEEVYRIALDLGGTISTQHGVGLARTPWVAQQYGRLFQVFQEIKTVFDPQNLFNPGKIIGGGGTALTENLRREIAPEPSPPPWRLKWEPGDIAVQCHNCNGCGACRTEQPAQRMCPLFRVRHTEAATPRAKANLLRSLLANGTGADGVSGDEVRTVADLCINCKMCAVECPANVRIPKLMLEAKAQHAAAHGLSRSDWVMARTENFAALGSGLAWFVNAALDNPTIRWWLQRLLGVSRRRKLPLFAQRSFLSMAARRGWTAPPRRAGAARVAFFVDVFANYNDPSIAEAAVAVLQHNGVDVYVPPDQIGCGMAPLAYGDVDMARRMARHNLRIFAELARAGYAIICSEPTAALMLRQDYRDLADDLDAKPVADKTVELTAFLWKLSEQGKLRTDFQPLPCAVGHHVPCHIKALGQGVAGPTLLNLIPEMRARTIDVSCSGMAGTFGLKEENFETSLAAGRPMLDQLRRDDLLFGASECSACRMQMEQGSGKRCLHPVQYLALAYGLMPEIADRLKEPMGKLMLR